MAYCDVELLLITFITAKRSVRCGVDTPADLTALPVVVVRRLPAGGDQTLTLDQAIVDVDVYHQDRASSRLLSEQIRSDLRLRLNGYTSGGGTVARVETAAAPGWVPYDNTALRKFTATYRITVHSAP